MIKAWMMKGAAGGGYQNETLAFQTRVLADGGIIVSLDDIDTAIVHAKLYDYYDDIKSWYSAQFAWKHVIPDNYYVAKLYDLSPNNNDVIGSGIKPLWAASLQNGRAGITFDGGPRLDGTTYAAASNYTLVLVSQTTTRDYNYREIFYNGFDIVGGFGIGQFNNLNRTVLHGAVAWDSDDTISTDSELVIAGYSTSVWMRVNGSDKTIGTSTFNAPSGGSLNLGGQTYGFIGHIFETIAFAISLDSATCQAIEAFQNAKWAIY
jgi:hypothetical protein